MNLQLFGGRGGSSGMGGGGGTILSPTERALKELEDGWTSYEDLSLSDQQLIVDYVKDFLVNNQDKGLVTDDRLGISRGDLSDVNAILEDIASNGFLNELNGQFVWVSYNETGSKNKAYHPGDSKITERDLKQLYKDFKSGKIKGVFYEDGDSTIIAGKGFIPLTSEESSSSYLTFGPGKMSWKKTKQTKSSASTVDYSAVKKMNRYGDDRLIKQPDSFEKLLSIEKRSLSLGLHTRVKEEYSRLRKKYSAEYDSYTKRVTNK